MKIYIAPHYTDQDFPQPHSFTTKVTLFHDRWRGWKLDIADKFLNGYENDGVRIPPVKDAGYAAMDVTFSYFEPIGKYVDGYCDPDDKRCSGQYFKLGVKDVLPTIKEHNDQEQVDVLLDMLWASVRCGLYHAGQPKGRITITGDIPEPIRIATKQRAMILNPHVLLEAVRTHADAYRDDLLQSGEASDLGVKFLRRYDYDTKTR